VALFTIPDVLDFKPKSRSRVATSIQRFWHSPRFFGFEQIDPDSPGLLVANHSLYGVIDVPLLVEEFYLKTNKHLRILADSFHFTMPWGKRFFDYGCVEGTKENCAKLMENGEWILVFPGGGREVFKRKHEKYQLTWKQRTGFARLAIEHGYPILPVASVGGDDCYDIHIDADDVMATWAGTLLDKTGINERFLRHGDVIPPLVSGLFGTPYPKSERFYYQIGDPIQTVQYRVNPENKIPYKEAQWQLRELVAAAINQQISYLRQLQASDTNRRLTDRTAPYSIE